jgi:hypothetical protein
MASNNPNEQTGNTAGGAQLSRRHAKYAKGNSRQDKALDLAQHLLNLQANDRFAEFKDDIEAAIRRVRFQGRRTGQSDRDLILSAAEQGCAEFDEFVEETGIPAKDVRAILDEFVMNDLFEMRERGRTEGARGAARLIWVMRSTLPGKEFFTRTSTSADDAAVGASSRRAA